MKRGEWIFCCLSLFVVLGCGQAASFSSGQDSLAMQGDSLRFEGERLFSINDNFIVIADSIHLESDSLERNALSGRLDTVNVVQKGDLLVVADYAVNPQDSVDSVWVKVARDQYTIGWVREGDLLRAIVPDAPISQFIHYFSNFNRVFSLLLMAMAVLAYFYRVSKRKAITMVHFNDIDSPYPTLLCVIVSGAAVFYGSIQHFAPETWVHYYYNPTLNPFVLPLGLGCFVTCVWAVILFWLAALDEVFRKLPVWDAVSYLCILACWCMLCYIFFSLSTPYYIGYFCFLVYVVFSACRYRHFRHYCCGVCGAVLPSATSICPQCGARNVY